MKLFDLHCDTITECSLEGKQLAKNDLHISLKKASYLESYCQLFAIWMPDEHRGEYACAYFEEILKTYNEQMEKNSKLIAMCRTGKELEKAVNDGRFASILTVEGGGAVAGNLDRINYLYDCGVRLMTLTWNGSNEIAHGCLSSNNSGLTDFGVSAVKRMQQLGMLVDVSHLNEAGFYDVVELSKQSEKPFIATHSCSNSVYKHLRNLTNEQIMLIIDSGGLIGLNLFRKFIGGDCVDKVYAHIYQMLTLGAEKTLAIGSDFDGCTIIMELLGIDSMPKLYDYLLSRNISQSVVDDIFFNNAYDFFVNNLT
ncbi:MAG: membrane dipeptidase [Oscillospiraceae bacterium]